MVGVAPILVPVLHPNPFVTLSHPLFCGRGHSTSDFPGGASCVSGPAVGLSWAANFDGLESWRGARAPVHALLQWGLLKLFVKASLLRLISCWHRATVRPNAKKMHGLVVVW